MKWHWLRYDYLFGKLRLYWGIETNNEDHSFKKHHPPIHHRQMQPHYIHTSNLVSKIPQTIILCEGVLNRLQCT